MATFKVKLLRGFRKGSLSFKAGSEKEALGLAVSQLAVEDRKMTEQVDLTVGDFKVSCIFEPATPKCSKPQHDWVLCNSFAGSSYEFCPHCNLSRSRGKGYGATSDQNGTHYHTSMEKPTYYVSSRLGSKKILNLRSSFPGLSFIPSKDLRGCPSCLGRKKVEALVGEML